MIEGRLCRKIPSENSETFLPLFCQHDNLATTSHDFCRGGRKATVLGFLLVLQSRVRFAVQNDGLIQIFEAFIPGPEEGAHETRLARRHYLNRNVVPQVAPRARGPAAGELARRRRDRRTRSASYRVRDVDVPLLGARSRA